jgi:hypothetical protein
MKIMKTYPTKICLCWDKDDQYEGRKGKDRRYYCKLCKGVIK